MNPDGKLLLVEPWFHVGRKEFEKEANAALKRDLSPSRGLQFV
jgi:hypothetical protein